MLVRWTDIDTDHAYIQKPNKTDMESKNSENERTMRALLFTCLLK